MRNFRTYILLGFLLHTFGATARDCSTADLNEKDSSPLRFMPVMDQDGSATCYGHTAATLLTYEHIANGGAPDTGVHPIFGAWAEKYLTSMIKSDDLNGGEAVDVINVIREKGFCNARDVEDRLRKLKEAGAKGITDAQLIYILETIYDNYSSFSSNPYHDVRVHARTARTEEKNLDVKGCHIDGVLAELKLKELLNIPATALLSKLFSGCKYENPVKIPKPKSTFRGTDEGILDKVDDALSRNKPAEVSLCANVFTDLNYKLRGVLTTVGGRNSIYNVPTDCEAHSVVVTGRKAFGGICKYLVRNSWGAKWKAESVSSCACILNNGKYQDVCTEPKKVREYVGCWFTEAVLGRNIVGVTSF